MKKILFALMGVSMTLLSFGQVVNQRIMNPVDNLLITNASNCPIDVIIFTYPDAGPCSQVMSYTVRIKPYAPSYQPTVYQANVGEYIAGFVAGGNPVDFCNGFKTQGWECGQLQMNVCGDMLDGCALPVGWLTPTGQQHTNPIQAIVAFTP